MGSYTADRIRKVLGRIKRNDRKNRQIIQIVSIFKKNTAKCSKIYNFY